LLHHNFQYLHSYIEYDITVRETVLHVCLNEFSTQNQVKRSLSTASIAGSLCGMQNYVIITHHPSYDSPHTPATNTPKLTK